MVCRYMSTQLAEHTTEQRALHRAGSQPCACPPMDHLLLHHRLQAGVFPEGASCPYDFSARVGVRVCVGGCVWGQRAAPAHVHPLASRISHLACSPLASRALRLGHLVLCGPAVPRVRPPSPRCWHCLRRAWHIVQGRTRCKLPHSAHRTLLRSVKTPRRTAIASHIGGTCGSSEPQSTHGTRA